MGLKTVEKKIGDINFTITQLGVLEGSKALLKLKQAVGPAIGTITRAVINGANQTEVLNTVLSTNVPDTEFEYLVKTFAASTKVDRPFTKEGRTVPQKLTECLDDVLGGDYMTLIAWLVFAVEVNYGDFFVAAIRMMGKDGPPAEKAE